MERLDAPEGNFNEKMTGKVGLYFEGRFNERMERLGCT